MRFNKYLENNINEFRSYTIKLTDKYTKNTNEVKKIINEYNLNSDIIKMIDNLNINFRKNQRSKLFFDFCLKNEGVEINKAKINKKVKDRFKLKCLTFNDELCKIQRKIENKIKNLEEIK